MGSVGRGWRGKGSHIRVLKEAGSVWVQRAAYFACETLRRDVNAVEILQSPYAHFCRVHCYEVPLLQWSLGSYSRIVASVISFLSDR